MKKILIFVLSVFAFASCEVIETEPTAASDNVKLTYYKCDSSDAIYTINIEGHDYIVFDGYHAGAMIHAEHCQCKNH